MGAFFYHLPTYYLLKYFDLQGLDQMNQNLIFAIVKSV
jgi:cytochrome c oxidase subunit IV